MKCVHSNLGADHRNGKWNNGKAETIIEEWESSIGTKCAEIQYITCKIVNHLIFYSIVSNCLTLNKIYTFPETIKLPIQQISQNANICIPIQNNERVHKDGR